MSEFYTSTVVIETVDHHPNADRLDVCTVLGGYPVISMRGAWKPGDLATYVSVDALVPVAHPFFEFLSSEAKGRPMHRVKAKRLRGIFSMGLLVPAVDGAVEGQDIAEALGIEKYESPQEQRMNRTTQHNATRGSRRSETLAYDRTTWAGAAVCSLVGFALFGVYGFGLAVIFAGLAEASIRWNRAKRKRPNAPIYDIEGLRKYGRILEVGEEVWITEKVHGMNARYVYTNRLHCGSRRMFVDGADDVWNRLASRYKLNEKLKAHRNVVLFGEVYGKGVQDMEYGLDDQDFVAFDAMDLFTRKYMDVDQFIAFCKEIDVPIVKTLYRGPWSENLRALAEGPSAMTGADHIREGYVVKPVVERHAHGLGRVILKECGEGYYTRKDDK